MTDQELREVLIGRIEGRRAELAAYLREHRPRNRRRANITLVLTSLAAVFTAAPAVGGSKFTEAVQKGLGFSSDTTVWRSLCLAALLVSAGAAVMTNIGKSRDDSEQISAVQAARAELDGLLTLLEFGQLSTEDAVKLYQQYTVAVPFVETSVPPVHHARPPADGAPSTAPPAQGPATQLAGLPPVPHRPGDAPRKAPPARPR
jgi:hypothetical protein